MVEVATPEEEKGHAILQTARNPSAQIGGPGPRVREVDGEILSLSPRDLEDLLERVTALLRKGQTGSDAATVFDLFTHADEPAGLYFANVLEDESLDVESAKDQFVALAIQAENPDLSMVVTFSALLLRQSHGGMLHEEKPAP